jgi:hypothetical protein
LSKIGSLTKEDWKKVGIGAGVAGIGAVVTYLVAWAGNIDFGTYTPLVAAISAVVVNLVRKFVTKTE